MPVHPPHRRQAMAPLAAIFANAQASLVLTTAALLETITPWFDETPDFKAECWLTTDNIITGNHLAEVWQMPSLNADSLAFLQYTSGSTTAPKGVMLTHYHLIENLKYIIQTSRLNLDEQREGVSWLPPYHDLGLVGMICLAIYSGRPFTLMSPVAFMQKPVRWLQAISRARATYSAAPNFAYDLCVDKTTPEQRAELDLSSWQMAVIGSEPIRYHTLERFVAAFAPCGFRREALYPAYGVSEATLVISGGLLTAPPVICTAQKQALKHNQVVTASPGDPDSQTLVGCGRPLDDHEVVIVDPHTLTPCAPDRVGEIWIAGPSVATGYWNQPEASQLAFQAYLAGGAGPYLRSGDLGFIKDGQLFIAGRLKDLIIIRGRNYYPQDIEQVAEASHPALRFNSGAAFSIEVEDLERLVIVFEVERRERHVNIDEVAAAIRTAVAQAYTIETYAVVLIKTGYLPKTASGKIQRFECRRQFLEQTLPVIGVSLQQPTEAMTPPETPVESVPLDDPAYLQLRQRLEQEMRAQLAGFLQVDPVRIELQRSIQSLGLGSLHATAIKYQLETAFGIDLSPEIFFADITLEQFIAQVAALAVSSQTSRSG